MLNNGCATLQNFMERTDNAAIQINQCSENCFTPQALQNHSDVLINRLDNYNILIINNTNL